MSDDSWKDKNWTCCCCGKKVCECPRITVNTDYTYTDQIQCTGIEEYSNMISSINVSTDLGRTELNELGRRSPYYKHVEFPIEMTLIPTILVKELLELLDHNNNILISFNAIYKEDEKDFEVEKLQQKLWKLKHDIEESAK